jgi:hypothetical protein
MLHPSSTRWFIHSLPLKTDEELLDPPEALEDSRGPRKTDFFVQSLKLIHYLGDILDSLHGQDCEQAATYERNEEQEDGRCSIGTRQFQRMLNLDSLLSKWQKQLPPHLQIQYGEPRSIYWRQSQVLIARYDILDSFFLLILI